MTIANANGYGNGLRRARFWEVDDDTGYPVSPTTTLDYGTDVGGGREFTVNPPQSKDLFHKDYDIVQAVDSLPPDEGLTATLTVGRQNMAVYATLSGSKERTIGEGKWMQLYGDNQGEEPNVILMLAQVYTDAGLRNWNHVVIPSAKCRMDMTSFTEAGTETTYNILANPVSKTAWGEILTTVADGVTASSIAQNVSVGKLQMCYGVGDGSAVDFTFDTDLPALSTDKVSVYVNGVEVSSGITVTVTKVTWAAAPAATDNIWIIYES